MNEFWSTVFANDTYAAEVEVYHYLTEDEGRRQFDHYQSTDEKNRYIGNLYEVYVELTHTILVDGKFESTIVDTFYFDGCDHDDYLEDDDEE